MNPGNGPGAKGNPYSDAYAEGRPFLAQQSYLSKVLWFGHFLLNVENSRHLGEGSIYYKTDTETIHH